MAKKRESTTSPTDRLSKLKTSRDSVLGRRATTGSKPAMARKSSLEVDGTLLKHFPSLGRLKTWKEIREAINKLVKDDEFVFLIDIGPDVVELQIERDEAGVEISSG